MNEDLRAQLMTTHEDVLVGDLKKLVGKERATKTEIISYLYVVQKRRIFAKYGYPDIHKFTQNHLGYTGDESHRRVSAMFLLFELPEIEKKISDGKLSLTNLSMAQTLFRREAKLEKAFTKEEKLELLGNLENKSTRDCEREIIKHSTEPVLIKERVRLLSEDFSEYKYVGSNRFGEKLRKLKDLRSNKDGDITSIELLKKLVDQAIEEETLKLTPKLPKPMKSRQEVLVKAGQPILMKARSTVAQLFANSHYVSTQSKRITFQKYQTQCSFEDSRTKQKCASRKYLQIDHILPIALGGSSDPDNLRILCRAHNQRAAIDKLGFHKMNRHLNKF